MIRALKNSNLGYVEGWLSIVVNFLLFAVKMWAGIVTGSIALVADAWHTLSDSLTSMVVLVGFKVSSMKPDREHPFGHGRAELIASVIIGVLLAVVGFNFLVSAFQKFRSHESTTFGTLAIVATVLSIVFKELLARFSFWAGKKVNSSALKADGWHHRSDAISSVIVLVGIFFSGYFWWIDSVLGILVALLILYATWEIMSEAISPLLGESPDDEFISLLKSEAGKFVQGRFSLHHVHLHRYGDHREVSFHLKFLFEISFHDAHDVATSVERHLLKGHKIMATIHIEPGFST